MLELKHISKKIDDYIILDDISLCFPDTGFIGVQGESGCGKSTLLYIIGMLDSQFEGEVLYNHEPITKQRQFIQENISYMMQNKDVISSMTVKENIQLPCRVSHQSFRYSQMKKICRQLGIDHLLERYPHQLSGGQLKRVSIGKALLKQSSILLCDEPTGALFEKQAHDIMKLLQRVSKERLVIIVSHDPLLLQHYCDSVLTLKDGHLSGECHTITEKQIINDKKTWKPLWIYPIRQLLYQKKKLLFVLIFQMIIISSIFMMITTLNGVLETLNQSEIHSVQAHLMTIEKKDQSSFEKYPSIQNSIIDDHYQLEQLQLSLQKKELSSQMSFLPHHTQHILLKEGRLPSNENEVIVTQDLYKAYQNQQTIHVEYDNLKMDFKITGVIEPTLFQEESIYCSRQLKEKLVFLKDTYSLDIEATKDTKQLYEQLTKSYIVYSDVLDRVESYQELLSLSKMIGLIFVGVSVLISLLLISIVKSILYEERRHDVAYLLSLGLSHMRLLILSLLESLFLGFVFVAGGLILATLIFYYINDVYELYKHFYFELRISPIWYSSIDLYVLFSLVFMMMTVIGGILPIQHILKVRMIDVLREE